MNKRYECISTKPWTLILAVLLSLSITAVPILVAASHFPQAHEVVCLLAVLGVACATAELAALRWRRLFQLHSTDGVVPRPSGPAKGAETLPPPNKPKQKGSEPMKPDFKRNNFVCEGCMEVYFNASAKRLSTWFTTIKLPYSMRYLMDNAEAYSLDSQHFQLIWREVFKRYDLPRNAKLESYEPSIHNLNALVRIRNKSKILKEWTAPDGPPVLTKIIQFYYDDIPWQFASNPAIVSYYFGDKLLCKFDVYYELPRSLGEAEILAEKYDASKFEYDQLMGACIHGEDIYNPGDVFDDNGRPLNYIEFLRWQEGTYEPDPDESESLRLLQAGDGNDTAGTHTEEDWDNVPLAV